MNNNDVLRRTRALFDYSDTEMISIFALANLEVDQTALTEYVKTTGHPGYQECDDVILATFLNGLIIEKRGKKDGLTPVSELTLTNNMILTKLKIAIELKTDEMLAIMALAEYEVTKVELGSFSRKPSNKHHRPCSDEFMLAFFKGLELRKNNSSKVSREQRQA